MGSDVFDNYAIPNDGLDEDGGSGVISGTTLTVTSTYGAVDGFSLDGTASAPGDDLVLGGLLSEATAFAVVGDGDGYIVGTYTDGNGIERTAVFSDLPVSTGQTFTIDTTLGHFSPDGACFAAGTGILTTRGEIAVEALAVGDSVMLADGRRAPVRWIGSRMVDCARHPRPWDVLPVRVSANAFGPGMPNADLIVSPDHAVFTGGVLMPVRYLLNGRTIRQEFRARVVYYHVELPTHAVLLAQGMPAESYLDTGNRASFDNGGAAIFQHPDFGSSEDAARAIWKRSACAELVTGGPGLAAARRALLERAEHLGARRTHDPAIRLLVDGGATPPARTDAGTLSFTLPAGARTGLLLSRTFVPAEMDPESDDTRRLGVPVLALWRDGAPIDLADPALSAGWMAPEPALRWTDGAGMIPLRGAGELRIVTAPLGRYWVDALPADPARAAAA